jgi:acetylornithine deacetylase/succinyl-diaminopimelate desuccinylase-like protein
MAATLPVDRVLTRLDDDFGGALERLKVLLRMPSIGTDPDYRAATRQTADWLAAELCALGFAASVRPTGGQPMVVAHHPGPGLGDGPRVLYYGHYDVQPAEPLDLWHTPPFEPAVVIGNRGPRIVARGAVDDKGQVMAFIEAFRAWQLEHGTLPVRVTVFLEGEEESGSASLEPFLEAHRDELSANVCVVSDTCLWDADTPALTTLLRGLLYVEVALSGPSHDLHSGLYGGAVPNPLNLLAQVLGQLHDAEGRVQIPGFYDDCEDLGAEAAAWAGLGFDERGFLAGIGLTEGRGEAGRSLLERVWSRPTCDLNGLWGGYTGPGSKTVIPAKAFAKLSFRLVPGQDPARVLAGLQAFLAARTPADCRFEVTQLGAAPALRVPTDSPYLAAAERALARTFGRAPVRVGMGGSIPAVGSIKRLLGTDALLMGFGLTDDRVHSPNEKFELACFRQGMRAHALLLAELAALR